MQTCNRINQIHGTVTAGTRKTAIKDLRFRYLTLFGLMLLCAAAVIAQARGGGRNYNPATEITVKGTIDSVTSTTGRGGWSGTHLRMKSGALAYDVHVGPSAYIEKSGFTFAAGDQIEVTGSKVQVNGAEALIARVITKSGKQLILRDQQGIPRWSGSRWNSQ